MLHQYGKALLEHCIRTSGALGGGGPAAGAPDADDAPGLLPTGKDPRFSFSGDAEQPENDEPEPEKKAAQKRKAPADEEEQNKGGAKEESEEEDDDLGVAFTVLDLARVIYQRVLSSSGTAAGSSASAASKGEGPAELRTLNDEVWDERTIRLELAEVHNDLGDVGLETENFEQASSDYAEALDILLPLLPPFSRRLADAHLRLGLALEFHPSVERRGEAETQIERARAALERRAKAVEKREGVQQDTGSLNKKESLVDLTADEAERELKDIKELIGDLENKVSGVLGHLWAWLTSSSWKSSRRPRLQRRTTPRASPRTLSWSRLSARPYSVSPRRSAESQVHLLLTRLSTTSAHWLRRRSGLTSRQPCHPP